MEECTFDVCLRDFRATDLTTRNRFKEKLKVTGEFDGKKFKTKKELIGGGDVSWKFSWKYEYKVFSHTLLEQKELKIRLMLSKTECYGTLSVDLYTLATGCVEHNLPIMDFNKKIVGRLNFCVDMAQITQVAVVFRQIKLRHLKPVNKECNPYLKYAYSKQWPAVVEGKLKAMYSSIQHNTTDPEWSDLPELRFTASLKELLLESVVMHVTHHGKVTNTTLGRCNLLFRTLVDNGKTFKDEDLISFRGPLKVENAEIEGLLIFKFLPRFAQMKPINVVRKAIHTETGIHDAMTLLPGLPLPKIPILVSQSEPAADTLRVSEDGRKRSATVKERSTKEVRDPSSIKEPEPEPARTKHTSFLDDSLQEEFLDKKLFPHAEEGGGIKRTSSKNRLQLSEVSRQKDLISFSPIPTRKLKSAPNLNKAADPFADLLNNTTPDTNPFVNNDQSQEFSHPTFNPFAVQEQEISTNPFKQP